MQNSPPPGSDAHAHGWAFQHIYLLGSLAQNAQNHGQGFVVFIGKANITILDYKTKLHNLKNWGSTLTCFKTVRFYSVVIISITHRERANTQHERGGGLSEYFNIIYLYRLM